MKTLSVVGNDSLNRYQSLRWYKDFDSYVLICGDDLFRSAGFLLIESESEPTFNNWPSGLKSLKVESYRKVENIHYLNIVALDADAEINQAYMNSLPRLYDDFEGYFLTSETMWLEALHRIVGNDVLRISEIQEKAGEEATLPIVVRMVEVEEESGAVLWHFAYDCRIAAPGEYTETKALEISLHEQSGWYAFDHKDWQYSKGGLKDEPEIRQPKEGLRFEQGRWV